MNNENSVQRRATIWSTEGRMGRKLFALMCLAVFVIAIIAFGIREYAESIGAESSSYICHVASVFFIVFVISFLLLYIICVINRLHDLNLSGYWWWAIWILSSLTYGVAAIIILILLCVLPGTKGDNKYGKSVP